MPGRAGHNSLIDIVWLRAGGGVCFIGLGQLREYIVCNFHPLIRSGVDAVADLMGNAPAGIIAAGLLPVCVRGDGICLEQAADAAPFDADMLAAGIHKTRR